MKYFFAAILSLIFLSCSAQKQIIEDKTVEIKVPELSLEIKEVEPVNVDSLLQKYIDSLATDSSFYEAEEITEKGDTVEVKFYLKDKETHKPKVAVKVKQSPVSYTYKDTLSIIKERTSLSDYFIYLIVLAVVVLIIIIFIKKIKR